MKSVSNESRPRKVTTLADHKYELGQVLMHIAQDGCASPTKLYVLSRVETKTGLSYYCRVIEYLGGHNRCDHYREDELMPYRRNRLNDKENEEQSVGIKWAWQIPPSDKHKRVPPPEGEHG